MKGRKRNIAAVIIVVLILAAGLTIRFSPTLDLKDRILSIVEQPGSPFHFFWGGNSTPQPEPTPSEKQETPLIIFPSEQPSSVVIDPGNSTIGTPPGGINELPMDVFPSGNP